MARVSGHAAGSLINVSRFESNVWFQTAGDPGYPPPIPPNTIHTGLIFTHPFTIYGTVTLTCGYYFWGGGGLRWSLEMPLALCPMAAGVCTGTRDCSVCRGNKLLGQNSEIWFVIVLTN